jgi:hypothetical protein
MMIFWTENNGLLLPPPKIDILLDGNRRVPYVAALIPSPQEMSGWFTLDYDGSCDFVEGLTNVCVVDRQNDRTFWALVTESIAALSVNGSDRHHVSYTAVGRIGIIISTSLA